MLPEGSVTELIVQVKGGDEQAMQRIWERYFRRLIGLARVRLRDTPRRAADEEDVALVALQSFFEGARQDRFPQLRDRHDLWRLLVKITVRRAINQRANVMAQKRGGGHVRGESVFLGTDFSSSPRGLDEAVERELTPEMADDVFARCRDLVDKLGDETLQHIAARKLEGYTNEEIAEQLGCVPRTIERKLSRIRAIWQSELEAR